MTTDARNFVTVKLRKKQMEALCNFMSEMLEALGEGAHEMSDEEVLGLQRLRNIHAKMYSQVFSGE